jgi:hypothetical protein
MDDPELVTLLDEDEPEPPPPPPPELGRKLIIQLVTVVILKVATGIAIRGLVKTVREFDVLYPEHLDKVNWKDPS